jgi:hypothetical protein
VIPASVQMAEVRQQESIILQNECPDASRSAVWSPMPRQSRAKASRGTTPSGSYDCVLRRCWYAASISSAIVRRAGGRTWCWCWWCWCWWSAARCCGCCSCCKAVCAWGCCSASSPRGWASQGVVKFVCAEPTTVAGRGKFWQSRSRVFLPG